MAQQFRSKPVATVIEKDVFKTVTRASQTGKAVKIREFRGRETERSAICLQHNRISKNFHGANEHGWVFFCSKKAITADMTGEQAARTVGHYFIADPPPNA